MQEKELKERMQCKNGKQQSSSVRSKQPKGHQEGMKRRCASSAGTLRSRDVGLVGRQVLVGR